MTEKWRPRIGEVVVYKPIRLKQGLIVPEQRVTVHSVHPGGTINVKLRDGSHRTVNLNTLKPDHA